MTKTLARIMFALTLVLAFASSALAQGTFVHRQAPAAFQNYSDTVFRVCTSNDASPCTTTSIFSDVALASAITQTSGVTLPGSKFADFYIANGNYVIQWYSAQTGSGYYTETLQAPVAGSNTSLTLGLAGSNVGALKLQNATSGTITLSPPTGALGTPTVTVQAATGTLALTNNAAVQVVSGIQSMTGNNVKLTSAFTSANSAALQAITGLSFALPSAFVGNVSFHCSLAYSQATPSAGNQFGVGVLTTAPTRVDATGVAYTNVTTSTAGPLTNLASTTPTAIVTFTTVPSTVLPAFIDGVAQIAGGGAATLQFYVLNGTAANVIAIAPGSNCSIQ